MFNGEQSQLTNLRAVRTGLSAARESARSRTSRSPTARRPTAFRAQGEVWPDSRLLAAIDAQLGSQLSIGAATFRVSRVLISRPDQGGTFSDLAPSLLMNLADIPATQLIQPGSRVSSSAAVRR